MGGVYKTLKSHSMIGAAVSLDEDYDYKYGCLFLADVAELALPIFEKEFPLCNLPRIAVQGIRDYYAGKITEAKLKTLNLGADFALEHAKATKATRGAVFAAASAYFASDSDQQALLALDSAANALGTTSNTKDFGWIEIERIFIEYFFEGRN